MNKENHHYLIPDGHAPEIKLNVGEVYTIGKAPDSHILISNSTVSRNHSRLLFKENNLF